MKAIFAYACAADITLSACLVCAGFKESDEHFSAQQPHDQPDDRATCCLAHAASAEQHYKKIESGMHEKVKDPAVRMPWPATMLADSCLLNLL